MPMMKNGFYSIMCLILVICMVFALSACSKKKDSSDIDEIFERLEIVDESETETEIPYFTEHIYIII
ncbi:MAG: hypothetical protein J6U68_01010, partial [Clostridia bacterium]|nr:hypothetical protein [Clostridia bacterium]